MLYKEAYTLIKKAGVFDTLASGITGSAYLLAAATAASIAAVSGGAGYLAAKVTSPGIQDKQNLEKEHRLARLKRDNETQKILAARQAQEASAPVNRTMRIFN